MMKIFYICCLIFLSQFVYSIAKHLKGVDLSLNEQAEKSRRALQEIAKEHTHAWKDLEVVDGLKNSEVAVMITSTTVHEGVFIWSRIIPSYRTWMRMFVNAFVIVEENIPIRFALRHCHETTYTHYSSFACHNEPTYILSRNCSNEYYGAAGPCCKVDDLFNYLINDRPELFREIKFVLHGDDDSFFRADEVMRWLAKVDKSGFNHLPIISNADATKPNEIGVWHLDGCKDIHANGWYQPMMLNHAALERMKVPSASYGLRDTCKHFDLTHDIGVGVYAWLLELNHIQFPRVEINGGHKGDVIFQPDQLVVHCVKPGKLDTCIDQNKWPYPDRYVEKLVIGCGDIEKQYPTHKSEDAVSMYDAWLYFRAHGVKLPLGEPGHFEWFKANVTVEYIKDHMGRDQVRAFDILPAGHVSKDGTYNGKKIEERVIPRVYPLLGYADTEHKKKYDITNTWHEFTQKDCRINKAPSN